MDAQSRHGRRRRDLDRAWPGHPVVGHVLIPVPVAAVFEQTLVDHFDHRHPRLVVLGQESIDQGPGSRLPVGGEEAQWGTGAEPAEDHHPGGVVPGRTLLGDVVAGEPRFGRTLRGGRGSTSGGLRHQRSRRKMAASSPMPPTRPNSSGAKVGGPISTL